MKICDQLERVAEGIKNVSSTVDQFVPTFNRVLIFQRNDDQQTFSSGSTRRFIGRSCIGNPEIAEDVDMSNAIVH